jgi:phage-related protein
LKYFETQFLEEAEKFIAKLDRKTISKVFYNIDIAEQTNDPNYSKNCRTTFGSLEQKFGGLQIRLLAFRDKTDDKNTLVFATHGFVKKVDKVPSNEIERASKIRAKYFDNKPKK